MVKKMATGLAACALGAAVGFAAWQLPAAFSRQASAACAAGAGQTAAAEGDGLSAACAVVGGAQAASLRLPAGSEQAFVLLPPAGEDAAAFGCSLLEETDSEGESGAEKPFLLPPAKQPREGAEPGRAEQGRAPAEADGTRPKAIAVTGVARRQAEADGLVLFGGVEAAGESMQEASERCEQAAKAVRQAFAPYGDVEEESSCAWPCGSAGYTAEHTFRFSCEDAGKAAELCRVLAEAGLRHIRALPVCRGEGMYGELLTAALQDATEKAQALGASGEPVRVEEFCCCRGEEGSLLLEARVRAVWVENQ